MHDHLSYVYPTIGGAYFFVLSIIVMTITLEAAPSESTGRSN